MNAKIDLELIRVFSAVADASSFSGGAKQLGVPVSTVSRAITRLEEALGHQVLHRTTRRVALSTAGMALYERTAPLLKALDEAVSNLPEREAEPSGELRITAPNDIGHAVLAEVLPLFARRYPAIQVDVRLTNRMVDMIAEGFDVAIRAWQKLPRDASLVMRRLANIEIQLFAAPTYLARRGEPRSFEDANQHDWVLFRNDWPRSQLHRSAHARIVCDDFAFVRTALRAGAGIGPLPSFLAYSAVAAGELVRVLPHHAAGMTRLVILHPKTQHVPRKVTAFRNFLLEQLTRRSYGFV